MPCDDADGIPDMNGSGANDVGVDSGLAMMMLSDRLQHTRILVTRIGIEIDHHAAGVTLGNSDESLGADLKEITGPCFLIEGLAGKAWLDVHIGAELARIDGNAGFTGQRANSSEAEDRNVLAIEDSPAAP